VAVRRNILFTATFHASFIDQDFRILQKNFNVTPVIGHGWTAFLCFAKHFASNSITFSWFASVYSSFLVYLATLSGRKSLLVLGGVDVAAEKELKYGIWNSWWKSKVVRFGITHANAVLAVDDFLRQEAMRLAKYDGANISVVPTGYDSEYWIPAQMKYDIVLTVASCPDITRVKLKGIDVFLSIAKRLPHVRFQIIGIDPRVASALTPPPNVSCVPFSNREAVRGSYQRAKVYCQLSYREGLPNALCEAMLCECIPIGTTVGGIPTAIGDTGYLVEYHDEKQTERAVCDALISSSERGKLARERVISLFSIEQREIALKGIIDKLVQ
jgi:glycosyltransferase involved in cell wall biosynthesis